MANDEALRRKVFCPLSCGNFQKDLYLDPLAIAHARRKRGEFTASKFFKEGDKGPAACGTPLGSTKWPALESKYYVPCTVVEAKHPRYAFESSNVRMTRKPIHGRGLV